MAMGEANNNRRRHQRFVFSSSEKMKRILDIELQSTMTPRKDSASPYPRTTTHSNKKARKRTYLESDHKSSSRDCHHFDYSRLNRVP